MAYFVFKRHGSRWDSMRLFAGPFDNYAAAQACFETLPRQQRHTYMILSDTQPNEALFYDNEARRKTAN